MRARRRGEGLIDHLLVVSVVALALVVTAYIMMPDFQKGVRGLVTHAAPWFGGS